MEKAGYYLVYSHVGKEGRGGKWKRWSYEVICLHSERGNRKRLSQSIYTSSTYAGPALLLHFLTKSCHLTALKSKFRREHRP